MQIRKSRKTAPAPATETRQSAEENLAWAAEARQFRHRDPLYHVTENFQQTFDGIGRSHAQDAANELADTMSGGFAKAADAIAGAMSGGFAEAADAAAKNASAPTWREPQDAHGPFARTRGEKKLWTGNAPSTLTRFSDTTFQRGAMSAAVLNGTGKMMLVSCLKRTVGESGPKRIQQQSLLGTGSQVRNIPKRSPDQMVFNRTFAKGALGIVVDTIRDARRVVDSMADMASGTGELYGQDSTTFRAMYPFLDNSRDLALEAEYREKLAKCTDEREKPILQNALVQTLALKAKKAQMKNEFINKLRFLSDRATETLAELETPGILDELVASVWGEREQELPENPDEGAEDDAPDGSENGDGAPERAGPGKRTEPERP